MGLLVFALDYVVQLSRLEDVLEVRLFTTVEDKREFVGLKELVRDVTKSSYVLGGWKNRIDCHFEGVFDHSWDDSCQERAG